jgi:NAD-dependent dihydropyrimidine dehydrogenase PreA subunit/predicted membrane protein
VMRCNHCEDAPCVEICPTSALFHRSNGIVDFDTASCIGCKSCMNACPYDALYIDPDELTAEKCNFCAHRIDVGLEPSCVVVCPTHSIWAGDLDDPASRISQMVARNDVAVRAPEQGTRPKVFYKGADQASLDPTRTAIAADGMIWADTTPGHPTPPVPDAEHQVARTAYTTAHPMPWGWRVSSYLVTKAVGAGALLIAALLVLLGHAGEQATVGVMPPVVGGAFTALTGVLLVADLKHPGRFHYILTRPNWGSWLTRGAAILAVYAALMAAWFVAGLLDAAGAIEMLAAPIALLAAATAGYTAYLFAQCEGRDLWQTPLLLPVLLGQAVALGAGTLLLGAPLLDLDVGHVRVLDWSLAGALAITLGLYAVEVTGRATRPVEAAIDILVRGEERGRFWTAVVTGLAAIVLAALGVGIIAGVAAIVSVVAYEHAFVRAGQLVPLS